MIKSEIRSRIKNILPKYDKEAKYHDRFLDSLIEKAITGLYYVEFKLNPNNLLRYTKRYGGTTAIPVIHDAIAQIYYCNYPEKIVPFPDKCSGVRRLNTVIQGAFRFYPMNIEELDLVMKGSYFSNVSSDIGFIPTLERIEFYHMTAAVIATGIRGDFVIPFSKYADTDDVYIPEVKDEEGRDFDALVLQFFNKEDASVDTLDNNENIKK